MQFDEIFLPLETELPNLCPREGVDFGVVLEDKNSALSHGQIQGDTLVILEEKEKRKRNLLQVFSFHGLTTDCILLFILCTVVVIAISPRSFACKIRKEGILFRNSTYCTHTHMPLTEGSVAFQRRKNIFHDTSNKHFRLCTFFFSGTNMFSISFVPFLSSYHDDRHQRRASDFPRFYWHDRIRAKIECVISRAYFSKIIFPDLCWMHLRSVELTSSRRFEKIHICLGRRLASGKIGRQIIN